MGGDSPESRARRKTRFHTLRGLLNSLNTIFQPVLLKWDAFSRALPVSRRLLASTKVRRLMFVLLGGTLLSSVCIATLSTFAEDGQVDGRFAPAPPAAQRRSLDSSKLSNRKKGSSSEAPWSAKILEEVRVKNRRRRAPAENHDMLRPRQGQSLSEITGHVRGSGTIHEEAAGKVVALPGQEIPASEVRNATPSCHLQ